MNVESISSNVLHINVNGKHTRGRIRSRWEQVMKDVTQKERRTWNKI
jgi:hypothetical protein